MVLLKDGAKCKTEFLDLELVCIHCLKFRTSYIHHYIFLSDWVHCNLGSALEIPNSIKVNI